MCVHEEGRLPLPYLSKMGIEKNELSSAHHPVPAEAARLAAVFLKFESVSGRRCSYFSHSHSSHSNLSQIYHIGLPFAWPGPFAAAAAATTTTTTTTTTTSTTTTPTATTTAFGLHI